MIILSEWTESQGLWDQRSLEWSVLCDVTFDHKVHLLVFILSYVAAEQAATPTARSRVATVHGATPHVAHTVCIDL